MFCTGGDDIAEIGIAKTLEDDAAATGHDRQFVDADAGQVPFQNAVGGGGGRRGYGEGAAGPVVQPEAAHLGAGVNLSFGMDGAFYAQNVPAAPQWKLGLSWER